MKTFRPLLAPAALVASALLFSACGNMKDQPNPRTLDPSDLFPDGMSARPWPAHTIARSQPAPGAPFETGFGPGGTPLTHAPVGFSAELLARGRGRFNIYCAVCHGEDGYGTGIVVRRGFPAPPSLHDNRLRHETDGHLFDAMTRGYGVMPPFVDRLTTTDRWAVIGYVRALQRSQQATLADVPAAERPALEQR
jgi:mono/diheme cytochrome c family protein